MLLKAKETKAEHIDIYCWGSGSWVFGKTKEYHWFLPHGFDKYDNRDVVARFIYAI